LTKNAYSSNSIARAVYDATLEAIRVACTSDAIPASEGANISLNDTIPSSSTEIGSAAGSRKAGILIILQDSNALYFNIGAAATTSHAKLRSDGESIFLPTNDSVYGLSASSSGSDISYVEI
jgi:hypothetical protein